MVLRCLLWLFSCCSEYVIARRGVVIYCMRSLVRCGAQILGVVELEIHLGEAECVLESWC